MSSVRQALWCGRDQWTGTLQCLQKEMATNRHWSVLAARLRRCPTLSNPVLWQSWMVVYPGCTLQSADAALCRVQMKTLFPCWPITVHYTHTKEEVNTTTLYGDLATSVNELCHSQCNWQHRISTKKYVVKPWRPSATIHQTLWIKLADCMSTSE